MDEGRYKLENGNVFLMTRTATGYLWGSWSEDDGKSWTIQTSFSSSRYTTYAFPLSDGKTLIAFITIGARFKPLTLPETISALRPLRRGPHLCGRRTWLEATIRIRDSPRTRNIGEISIRLI